MVLELMTGGRDGGMEEEETVLRGVATPAETHTKAELLAWKL